jgi:hypothetical protein
MPNDTESTPSGNSDACFFDRIIVLVKYCGIHFNFVFSCPFNGGNASLMHCSIVYFNIDYIHTQILLGFWDDG